MIFVLDSGHSRVKWFNPASNRYGDFRHAVHELTEAEWTRALQRGWREGSGFVRVDGKPFVVGDDARRYVIKERPSGAGRYHRYYYGVTLAAALIADASVASKDAKSAGMTIRQNRNIKLMASHPPQDIDYADDLVSSVEGEIVVESPSGQHTFKISEVITFDEPIGGYSHFSFTEKGVPIKRNPLANATTLVVDVGGYTTDVAAVDPGGVIDLMSPQSTRAGVIAVTEQFYSELRTAYKQEFRSNPEIDIQKIEKAILAGCYQYGRLKLDCQDIAEAAINGLTNQVLDVINSAGGVANYEYILLTGGGSVLIEKSLVKALPAAQFIPAEKNNDLRKYANVFGGAKIAALLQNVGEL